MVFSEYAVSKPEAWTHIVEPMLLENGGWAIFPYTPRGKNHGKTLFDMARKNPNWFAEILTVDDTLAIPPSAIQEERDSERILRIARLEPWRSRVRPAGD